MKNDQTYVGPRDPSDRVQDDPSIKPPTSGGTFAAISLGVIGIILGFGAIWIANGADGHTELVDGKVTALRGEYEGFVKNTNDKFNDVALKLAKQVTETNNLNDAVAKLQSKAEQSVVDQLSKELKDKASKASVQDLAAELLNKADAKTVRRLSRRMDKYDTRLVAVENIVLPPPAEPAPAPAAAPAKPADPPKPAAAAPAPPAAQPAPPAKAPLPPAIGPTGKPETPAKPALLTK